MSETIKLLELLKVVHDNYNHIQQLETIAKLIAKAYPENTDIQDVIENTILNHYSETQRVHDIDYVLNQLSPECYKKFINFRDKYYNKPQNLL